MAVPAALGAAAPRVGAAARGIHLPALALTFFSGAAGLTWQMVWSAQLGMALGHEMVAVLAVLAAFFGGMAGGAFLLAGGIERSARPALWYAGLEALVAAWALLVLFTFEQALPQVARAIGPEPSVLRHWAIAFFLPFLLLLPATVAMGATLPALERALRGQVDRALGAVYASNTAGALAGLLFAVFHAIPQWGLQRTTFVFAGVNALCAAAAWFAWRGQRVAVVGADDSVRGWPWRLFFTGLLGIGYEVLVLRALSQVTENTVYTYAVLLALFLVGTAAGAALVRGVGRALDTDGLLAALVLAMGLGGASLWQADRLAAWGSLAGETACGVLALVPASLVMGALFTHLCQQAQAVRLPLGQALGWNTLGAALAPLAVGVVLVPQAGAAWTLCILLLGYLALRSRAAARGSIAAAVVIVAGIAAAPALRFVDVPPGGRIASYREGVLAAVSVVEDAEGVARLHINNRVQEGSSASGLVETRLAQLPLLLHPAPHRALFLGVGTGYTTRAAALDPGLQVDAVELVPEVIAAAGDFAQAAGAPRSSPRLVAADARRYVQAASGGYDVIVSDLFHPARSGAGSLYTVEHFAAVRARLRPGGLFCQWLALHQMDLGTLRSIVAAYLQVYPEAVAVLASNSLDTPVLGLVAIADRSGWRAEAMERRLASSPPALAAAIGAARLQDPCAVLGSLVAGPQALRRFSADVAPNTDDRPFVTYHAPWATYAPGASPRARLAELIAQLQPEAGDILGARGPEAPRLAAYWQARAQYLRIGLDVRPLADPQAMLRQLHAPLLGVLARSPDFRPAAEPLLALAQAVRRDDPVLSAQVLQELRQLRVSPASLP